MSDANKSTLTKHITAAAASWLDGIGAKPVETEVFITRGWVADLAALWCPTRTEAIKTKILPRKPTWGGDPDWHEKLNAWEERYRGLPRIITIVHEVKVSLNDFKRDAKWVREPVSDMKVLSIPKGLVQEEDWPEGWWILEHSRKSGKVLRIRRVTQFFPIDDSARLGIAHAIAVRRDNVTRYERYRSLMKGRREQDNERINRRRYSSIASFALAVARAEHPSVEECFKWHIGSRKKLPKYIEEKYQALYGVMKAEEAIRCQ